MSGEGFGYILAAPIVIGGVAIAGMGLAAYGAVRLLIWGAKAGVEIAVAVNDKRKEREVAIGNANLDKQDKNIRDAFSAMHVISDDTKKDIIAQTNKRIEKMQAILATGDGTAYEAFLNSMAEENRNIQKMIKSNTEAIKVKCEKVVSDNIATFVTEMNSAQKSLIDRINDVSLSIDEKNKIAKEEAEKQIEEIKNLIKELENSMELTKWNPELMSSIKNQLNSAIDSYNKNMYEASIASVFDCRIAVQECVYDSEVKRVQYETALQLAYEATHGLYAYVDSQEEFTADAEAYLKENGLEIDEQIKADFLADYACDITVIDPIEGKKSVNEFDYIRDQVKTTLDKLEAIKDGKDDSYTTEELEDIAIKMKGENFEAASKMLNTAALNMGNRYFRVEYAYDFMKFLEDKNFECKIEQDEKANGPIYVYVNNVATKEEVVYSFTKYNPGESVKVIHTNYDMLSGDPSDKKREDYYQHVLLDEFNGKAQLQDKGITAPNISCKSGSGGKLSSRKEELKKVFKLS